MTEMSFVRKIRAEYLSLAIGFLIIGLITSTPLNLDFAKSLADLEKMGIKIVYLLIGGITIAYLAINKLSTFSHLAARFVASIGVFMLFYPFLSLVSAIEKPSVWMALGTLTSISIFSYVIADFLSAKRSLYYKKVTEE
jgi:hypothetical protein